MLRFLILATILSSLNSIFAEEKPMAVVAAHKWAPNREYVAVLKEYSPLFAKCFPDNTRGSEGTTQILRVRREGDEVLAVLPWYNRYGLVLGWSPTAGKVATMRVKQDEGLAAEKQVELSFYLGDQFLKSYTTSQLAKLGADVVRDTHAAEAGLGSDSKRASYSVEGCKQVWNSNDYYFSVRLNPTKTLSFDIVTGKLCRIEADGDRRQRLVHVDE